ncbi:MAG: hypothetical protein Q9227_002565 [Pyrenula ochraceoflavens]
MASHPHAPTLRSLYRSFLRELPPRPSTRSPLQTHLRASFSSPSPSQSPSSNDESTTLNNKLQAAQQYLQYVQAQRKYKTLLERYNPGMDMSEEDRVRLTARRVGMDLPVDLMPGSGRGKE